MAKPAGPSHLMQSLSEAVALHRQGRLDEAEKLYNRVLKLQRDNFDALHLLGLLHHQRGEAGEAYRQITAALKVNPRSADALSNLALVLHALKRHDEALASLDKALAIAPGHLDALNNRGTILLDLKRPAEAVAAFEAALATEPRHLQALVNRGNARAELAQQDARQAELAMTDYDAALKLAPGHPLALYNRGNAHRQAGRLNEAIADYDRALAVMPEHRNAWLNRGLALAALNRHRDAVESYGRVLVASTADADARFNAALSLLALGDYARGFAEYEWRWKRTGMTARKDLRRPLWRGETPLAGKTILLHAEQGLGDTVQFVRYAPLLARQGAHVALEVQPELKELLSSMEGVAAVVAKDTALPAHDLHCPLASLPLAFRTGPENIPAAFPYLRASEERIAKWRPRIEALPSPRIALAWSGRATHVNDRNRSIALAELEPLLAMPGPGFVSVQRELRQADAGRLASDPRILHLGDELSDFGDTAAVLALADLIVCVDTSVAHVAGALGRPALVLLPFQPDWRWTLDRESSPWYPHLRLLRQSRPGDWPGVIGRLCEALPQILAGPSGAG